MKTIVCVKTKEAYLDLQKVRKMLISRGVDVLDFYEESISEVHYVTRNMNEEAEKELKENYIVETYNGSS